MFHSSCLCGFRRAVAAARAFFLSRPAVSALPRMAARLMVLCLAVLCSAVFPAYAAPGASGSAPVSPAAVTLFPDRALLECVQTLEQRALSGGQRGVVISLPAQADPSTLRLVPDKGTLADVRWERTAAEAQEPVLALRAELDRLSRERALAMGELQATEARIALWSDSGMAEVTAAELERVDAAMARHLASLHAARYDIARRQQELDAAVKRVEEQLERASGGEAQTWTVQAVLADAPATVSMRYSYVLAGSGWTPLYRFDARPGEGRVAVNFEAEIEQSSGMDWQHARIALATMERFVTLDPPYMQEWLIGQQQPVLLRAEAAMEGAGMRAAPMMKAADAAPVQVQRGTYAVWELGERTVPAGRRMLLPVVAEWWTTPFVYTARPASDDKAYLTARVALAQPREMPHGTAMFLVDGALVGKRGFGLSGSETELYFGADPLVTATMRLLDRQGGEKGVIGRRQSMVWAWDITLQNNRPHPVALVVEEPEPQPGHTDIRVETVSQPAPRKTEDRTFIWELELAPRGQQVITHTVTVSAPKDMDVDFGRGR